jgi:hypothetical protein
MKTRKSMVKNRILENRYWKRTPGGGYCDSCGLFLAGFLTPHKHKITKRVLCFTCYENGK